MHSLEFIDFTIEHWPTIIFWSLLIILSLFFYFRELTPVKNYDPFHFYVTFNLGSGYAVLVSLYQYGYISHRLFFLMLLFAFVLLGSLRYYLKVKPKLPIKYFKLFFSPVKNGRIEFSTVLVLYFAFSIIVILLSGFGALSSAERFENARGVGMFIRVLDFFRLIILAYIAIKFVQEKKVTYAKIGLLFLLILFLIFSSLLGGAKYAFLEGIFVVFVAAGKFLGRVKISIMGVTLLFGFATAFAILLIYLGDKDKDSTGIYNDNTNVVVQKLGARILANGDSYYGSLPYETIESIEVDAVWVRFISPIIGVGLTTKILGYPVENYSVGRAILLHHDPNNEISGGPVSHYDLFSYVYFGFFGIFFILFLSYVIANVAVSIDASTNIFYISVTAALWNRCLAMLLEPSVGIAYVFDAFVLLGAIKLFSICIYNSSLRKSTV